MNDYQNLRFIKFEKSNRKNKKYDAVMKNTTTGREVKIPFGDSRYEHYKDSTGLGVWTHKNHNDDNRRKSYRARHNSTAQKKYSPSWFSYHYLW